VFDVTPAELIDVIVTEKGVLKSPDTRKMADFKTLIS
jgi:methylthioribose-1-phosphate isomerase